ADVAAGSRDDGGTDARDDRRREGGRGQDRWPPLARPGDRDRAAGAAARGRELVRGAAREPGAAEGHAHVPASLAAPPRGHVIEIRILTGARAGQTDRFDKPVLVIRRHATAYLRFSPETALDVSGPHAEIRQTDGRHTSTDLGSTYGSFACATQVEA